MTMGRLLYFRCSRCGQLLSFSGQSASLWIMSSSELLCRIKEMLKFWPRRYNVFRDLATLLCWQSMIHICSVLFFSRPRSECSPHYGRTFPIYLCPLSFWLTLSQGVLSTYWCCPSRPCGPAVRGLPRLRAPGIVPCIISFYRQLPPFLMVWP